MTGEGVAMWLGESSLTEAAADDNGMFMLATFSLESDQ